MTPLKPIGGSRSDQPSTAVTAANAIRRQPLTLEVRLTLALAFAAAVSCGAILGITFLVHRSFAPPHRATALVSAIYPAGTFTVNLLDGAMLKVAMGFEIAPADNASAGSLGRESLALRLEALQRQIAQGEARYRDAVIQVLSGKRLDELMTPLGKDELKLQILKALNARGLSGGQFTGVYFSEFTLQ